MAILRFFRNIERMAEALENIGFWLEQQYRWGSRS